MKASALPFGMLLVALAAPACAPSSTPAETAAPTAAPAAEEGARSDEDVTTMISQLEREWVAAIVNKDTATLDRLIADDFVGTSPSAHSYTKSIALEDLTSGRYVVEAMTLDEITVNSYGNVAIAFTSQEEKSHYSEADTSGHYHYTDVWLKRGGTWQVVASHGTQYLSALPNERG